MPHHLLKQANREALAPVVVQMLQQASAGCPVGVDLATLPGEGRALFSR